MLLLLHKGYLYLAVTIFFFSTYEVIGRTLNGVVNPLQINFLRFLGGGLLLLPLALRNARIQRFKFTWADIGLLALIGLVNVVVSMSFLQIGINLTSASLAAVIFSSNPLFVMLAAAFLLGERLTLRKLFGLFLGILGLGVVFYKQVAIGGGHFSLGVVFLILSAVAYGLYTVLGKKFTLKADSMVMNSFSFLLGSGLLLPALLFTRAPIFSLPPQAWVPMAYLTVFVTGIAYYTYFLGLACLNTGAGAMTFFIKPILAGILAVVFLGERISASFIIGTMIILCGMLLVQTDTYPSQVRSRFSFKESQRPASTLKLDP